MWIALILEFVLIVIVSLLYVNILEKYKNNKDENN